MSDCGDCGDCGDCDCGNCDCCDCGEYDCDFGCCGPKGVSSNLPGSETCDIDECLFDYFFCSCFGNGSDGVGDHSDQIQSNNVSGETTELFCNMCDCLSSTSTQPDAVYHTSRDNRRQMPIYNHHVDSVLLGNNLELQRNNSELQENNLELQENNPELRENNLELQEDNLELQENNPELQENNPELQGSK